ncbi:phosphoglycerate mutase [Listeria fleischmannii 1991]|uniref:phosphoglycerate mutase (2,3-diphosphoglycerate-dependent) n=2 Tax=Listeria fleischmannii TaxID=1069827 RepID=A0A2X3JGA2_9LIST|nr:histidine phosphatase family protein [Listeria fleischmannii]EMG29180.1 putative phosphoglycero mutase [Listeria fleischmannii subsp. fleischmannii LU2006-1]KMT58871.1 phosphoglycerate mutase [Listeria fleischmannii 1991]SQC72159.1 2,3-bisphosphoglycerate-dependent phosphoglycerate mutase [Listeria fleischmannii subsp. fleischmannii]
MTKKLALYFVRHGQTYLNKNLRMQGWADTPLTPEGAEIVRQSGRGLSDTEFVAAYSSDLHRTISTAKILLHENKHGFGLQLEPRSEFRETFFGSFEGEKGDVAWGEIARFNGYDSQEDFFSKVDVRTMMNDTKKADPTGDAEDFMTFWTRVEKGFLHVINRHRDTGGNILIVAHGNTIRNIVHELEPSITESFVLDNASVTVLTYENGLFKVERLNDISHFRAE